MRKLLAAAAAALGLTVFVGPANAITGNFVPDNEHPYVGLIAFYNADDEFMWRCSGSLLTPTVFLTAGHCTDQDAAESPAYARVWFQQDAGASYDPATQQDPVTGYPDACFDSTGTAVPSTTLCTTASTLYDYGFDDFAGFPNTHDVGVAILDTPISLSEYGELAAPGFLDSLVTQRGRQDTTFTASGYGVTRTLQNNPAKTISFRSRLMAETQLVNMNSAQSGGFNIQLSSAPAKGRGGTCFGDSGGPIFYGPYSSNTIVAVNSFVLNGNCAGTGFGYRVDTQAVFEWLQSLPEVAAQWGDITIVER